MSSQINHKKRSKIAFTISGVLLAILLILAGVLIYKYDKGTNFEPNPNNDIIMVSDDGFPDVDWDYWKSINPDVIGWITIPDTGIDYPVVQAPSWNPQYYLYHDVYGDYNYTGCPYLDADCEEHGFLSTNAVIFGHNMGWNDEVFASIARFTDSDFATSHRRVLVQTPDAKFDLKVKASTCINGWSRAKRTEFSNHDDFNNWYQAQIENAWCVIDGTTPGRNITLATCSYNYWSNERTLVFASK